MSERTGTSEHQPPSDQGFSALKRAWGKLELAIARHANADERAWIENMQVVARETFPLLQLHQELTEESGGMLPEATAEKPGLMAARDRLEHEHSDMLHRVAEIEIQTERQLTSGDFGVELLRLEATVLRDILRLHMARTDLLVADAYLRVEGGEGG